MQLRNYLYHALEYGEGRLGRALALSIPVLVIISLLLLPFELLPWFEHLLPLLHRIELGIVTIFILEYLARIYAAPSRLGYIFSWYGLIDLVAIVPVFMHFDTLFVRVLSLIRLARILKIAEWEGVKHHHFKLKRQSPLPLLPGEELEYIASKHPLIFMLNLVPALLPIIVGLLIFALWPGEYAGAALGAFTIFSLLFIYKAWLDFAYDTILITNFRVVVYNRYFFGSDTFDLHFKDIKEIAASHPNMLAYFLGYGTLQIIGIGKDIALHSIVDHEKIADHIYHKKLLTERRVEQVQH